MPVLALRLALTAVGPWLLSFLVLEMGLVLRAVVAMRAMGLML